MRHLLCLVVALPLVGCCSGVDPSAVSYSAAPTYTAVEPEQHFGVTREAKAALLIPADAAGCLATGAGKILVDATDTLRCLLNTVTPPVVTPVQRVQVLAPAAATCASGSCAPPPAKAAAPCR